MTTDIVHIARATGYDQTKVQLVKDTIAKGASDDELMLFLHLAQRTGLDPFTRQIYLIERRSQVDGQWKTTRQTQTGIDGLRLIAERSERYAPGREPTFAYDAEGRLVKATAYVKKWVRGEWHEVAASAHFDEYVQRRKDGGATQFWADKPHIMLAKCAEALALRRAFPADMGGLYTADEVGTTEVLSLPPAPPADPVTGEVINMPAPAHQNGNGTAKGQALVDAVKVFIDCATAIGIEVEIDDFGNLSNRTDDELKAAGKALRSAVVGHIQQLEAQLKELDPGCTLTHDGVLMKMKAADLQALGLRTIECITELTDQPALVEAAPARQLHDGELPL